MSVNVGMSFNPEVVAMSDWGSSVEKKSLSFDMSFSGSSANVAYALRACGSDVGLFGLVGPKTTLRTDLLRVVMKHSKSPLPVPLLLSVLTDTNIAVIAFDPSNAKNTVAGDKGEIVEERVRLALRQLARFIDKKPDAFAVMTGFRKEELRFANVVYEKTPVGKRVLCPREAFCRDNVFPSFLSSVDCLVVNQGEFDAAGGNARNLIGLGPRVVIVTKGKNGGDCYVKGKRVVSYKPHVVTDMESTGTGDAWLGAFVAWMDHANETFLSATPDSVRRATQFAARYAGEKAAIAGGANGPPEQIISQLLREM